MSSHSMEETTTFLSGALSPVRASNGGAGGVFLDGTGADNDCWLLAAGCKMTLCRCRSFPLLCVWSFTCTGRIKACWLNSNIRVGFLQNYGILLLEKNKLMFQGGRHWRTAITRHADQTRLLFVFFSIVGNKETSLCLNLLQRF